MSKTAIICGTTVVLFLLSITCIIETRNTELEKEFVKAGLEQCTVSWGAQIIWVKNCAELIKQKEK